VDAYQETAAKSMEFSVSLRPVEIVSVTCNTDEPRYDMPVTWTVNAAYGTAPYAYSYTLLLNGETVCTVEDAAENTFSYTFAASGAYALHVGVKDGSGTECVSSVSGVVADRALEIVSVVSNVSAEQAGRPVTWTVEARGGSKPLRYAFDLFIDGEEMDGAAFSESNTYTYTPQTKGEYTVAARVRDAAGTTVTMTSAAVTVTDSTPVQYFEYVQYSGGFIGIRGYTGPYQEVVVPDEIDGMPVTVIGLEAFYGRSDLTDVILPESITTIDLNAFYGCSGLTSLVLPDGMTSIGSNAFYGCSGLTAVVVPDGVVSIGGRAFQNCTGLTSVVLPKALETVEDSLFYNCSSLSSIVMPEKITSIGGNAFYQCTSLASVVLPQSVTSIGPYAFGRSGLSEIWLPDDAAIGAGAFDRCYSAKKYTDKDGLTALEMTSRGYSFTDQEYPMLSLQAYETENEARTFTVAGCDQSATQVFFPENTTGFANSAFSNCTALTEIHIPETLTYVQSSFAFTGCNAKRYAGRNTSAAMALSKAKVSFSDPQYPYLNLIASEDGNGLRTYAVESCDKTAQQAAFPENVTGINSYAFSGCAGIQSIEIPDGVTAIGIETFSDCTSLQSVKFAPGIVSIGMRAFQGCTSLREISLPDMLTQLDGSAFLGCTALEHVTIPGSLTTIGNTPFYGCSALSSVVFEEGLQTVGKNLFENCASLKTVDFADSITQIENYAFSGCTALTGITLPKNLVSIGYAAFGNCQSLTELVLPQTLSVIGAHAFGGCTSVEYIFLPDNLRSIGDYAVSSDMGTVLAREGSYGATWCRNNAQITWMIYENNETGLRIVDFQCGGTYFDPIDKLRVPEMIDGVPVTEIGPEAFASNNYVKEIELPDSVQKIGDAAFKFSWGLEKITLPEGITEIGNEAFYQCEKLKEINFPQGLSSIGDYAFYKCASLENLQITQAISSLGEGAFAECPGLERINLEHLTAIPARAFYGVGLTSIVVPDNVVSIGEAAFADCVNLVSASLPDHITSISANLFAYCSSLQGFEFSENVKTIGERAFFGCTGFTEINLPDSLETIENNAFGETDTLCEVVYIPETVKTIRRYAFAGTLSRESNSLFMVRDGSPAHTWVKSTYSKYIAYRIEAGTAEITACYLANEAVLPDMIEGCPVTVLGDGVFRASTSMTSLTLPDSIVSIGDRAFENCASLKSLHLPESLEYLGSSAMKNCYALEEIRIPSGVTSLGANAFESCRALAAVYLPEHLQSIGDYAFRGCQALAQINIPDSLVSIGAQA